VKELRQIPGIAVTDQVSSMIEYLYGSTVCVIPIRKSTGTKIRSLQTLATSTPLVASDCGLERLPIDDTGVTLSAMSSNGIHKYIYTIICLFEQPKLREKLSINGLVLIEQEYTWERTDKRYEQLLIHLTS
jgi:polysaccharide biosynthesis protein PslH